MTKPIPVIGATAKTGRRVAAMNCNTLQLRVDVAWGVSHTDLAIVTHFCVPPRRVPQYFGDNWA